MRPCLRFDDPTAKPIKIYETIIIVKISMYFSTLFLPSFIYHKNNFKKATSAGTTRVVDLTQFSLNQ